VLRGGSFNNNRNNARCAYRNRNNPNNRNRNNGFRVVVSHNFLVLPAMSPGYGWVTEALRDGTTAPLAESRVLVREPGEHRIGPAPGHPSLSRATPTVNLPESTQLSGS
jgi:hypothetical protein